MSRRDRKALQAHYDATNPRLDTRLNKSKTKSKTQWWNPIHSVAAMITVAVLAAGGVYGFVWLDGRSVSEGVDDLLARSEAANGDVKEGTIDVVPVVYKNCAALNEVYPTGINRVSYPKTYTANKALDTDTDGWACESG